MNTYFQSYDDFISNLNLKYSQLKDDFDHQLRYDEYLSNAIVKMVLLDVDAVFDLIKPLYSPIGRPAKNQIPILRSFILMAHYRTYSVDRWVAKLRRNPVLAAVCGFTDRVSSVSSHYDLIHRLYRGKKYKRSDFVLDHKPYRDKPKKSEAPSKGEKWKNHDDKITVQIYEASLNNENTAEDLDEYYFLKLFDILAVQYSKKHGLIEDNIIISGDGTCFHGHAHAYGKNIKNDDVNKRYSDLDASWGWDSDKNMFYFGYTGYSISYINRKYHIDLPVFLTMTKASQHDAITSMTALTQLCSINNCINFTHYCLDCASDNVSTHMLAYSLGILPVIDINHRLTGKNIYEPYEGISKNGRPICMAGHECVRDGYEKARFRHKFRCPYAQRKDNPCPLREKCSKSIYGRVFHIKSKDDPRLFGVVQYNTPEWKTIFRDRTSCERINNRIINDYRFKDNFMRGKAHNFFMLMIVGINIHLDAHIKVQSL